MLSQEIYVYYKYVENKIDELDEYLSVLFNWKQEYYNEIKLILEKILSSSVTKTGIDTHYVVRNGVLKENFKEIKEKLKKKFDIIPFTIKFGEIKREIISYKEKSNIPVDYIDNLLITTDKLLEQYQKWWRDESIENMLVLGNAIIEYEVIYNTAKETYRNFINLYTDEKEKIEDNKIIEIQLLDVQFDLEEFNSVLTSINKLYYELGNIMYPDIGVIQYEKLNIVKIESGSIWTILFGDENILSALAKLLNKTVELVFNKFTFEGKIYRQKEFTNAIQDSLGIAQILKENGYKVDEAQENIQKAFVCSTKNLINIAEKSPKIKINNEIHELNPTIKNKYLEANKKLLLTNGENKDKE